MGVAISLLLQGVCCVGCVACYAARCLGGFTAPRLMHVIFAAVILGLAQLLSSDAVLAKVEKAHTYGGRQLLGDLSVADGCSTAFFRACEAGQVAYAASLSLVLYFAVVGAVGSGFEFFWARLWGLKLVLLVATFISMLFVPAAWRSIYAEMARALALVWLAFQGLLVIDLAHHLHEGLAAKADGESGCTPWRALYLAVCAIFLGAAATGLTVLYADHTGCGLGAFLVNATAVVGVGAGVLSLLDRTGVGLLPPSAVVAYSVLLCYSALGSDDDAACNPAAGQTVRDSSSKQVARMLMMAVLSATVIWCAVSGEKMREIFQIDSGRSSTDRAGFAPLRSGSGDAAAAAAEAEAEPPASRALFCAMMAMAAACGCMVMTGWAAPDGTPEGTGAAAAAAAAGDAGADAGAWAAAWSLWIKILAQWLTLAMQLRILWVAYRDGGDTYY